MTPSNTRSSPCSMRLLLLAKEDCGRSASRLDHQTQRSLGPGEENGCNSPTSQRPRQRWRGPGGCSAASYISATASHSLCSGTGSSSASYAVKLSSLINSVLPQPPSQSTS